MYYYIRRFLRWFCAITKQQCSGKYRSGFATVWCRETSFHDGACVDYSGKVFTDGTAVLEREAKQ